VTEGESPSIVLDTNIVSYLLGNTPRAAACKPHVEHRVAAISFQTVAELWYGAEHRRWGPSRRAALDHAIRRFVVLTADEATSRAWAEQRVEAERAGKAKEAEDLWIAATAKRHDLPLLSEDSDFFSALSIRAVRPTDPPI
jgi:predicted nucleic acid-binding protein